MQEARNQSRREPVLEAVRERYDHPTADEIFTDVRARSPKVSRATVYRNLRTLAREGVILTIPVSGSADRFDLRSEPHYHFHCRVCDRIFDVPMTYRRDLDEAAPAEYILESHELLLRGVCPHCRDKEEAI